MSLYYSTASKRIIVSPRIDAMGFQWLLDEGFIIHSVEEISSSLDFYPLTICLEKPCFYCTKNLQAVVILDNLSRVPIPSTFRMSVIYIKEFALDHN